MPTHRETLLEYLNQQLTPEVFKDYCPNGLQVEGKPEVKKILTAVTASLNAVNAAVKEQADMLLVHHGYFWPGEASVITGMIKQRIAGLLNHDINLVAYHLPLDAHETYGNNIELAKRLGFSATRQLNKEGIGLVGRLNHPMTSFELCQHINQKLGRMPLFVAGKTLDKASKIETIAWCTGAAEGFIEQAAKHQVDAYLTGEASERTTHSARELGIDFIAAGHHATERYGVQALGQHLADKFGIEHVYFEDENPV